MKIFDPWDLDNSYVFSTKIMEIVFAIFLIIILVGLARMYFEKNLRLAKYNKYGIITVVTFLNFLFVNMFYWYLAIPIAMSCSVMFYLGGNNDLKKIHLEELKGITGSNKKYRVLQKNQFDNLTDDEKTKWIDYYNDNEIRINVPVSVCISFVEILALIMIFYILDIGYII